MSVPSRRLTALLRQIAPAADDTSRSMRFPGCSSVLDVSPCSGSTSASPADQHCPTAASLTSEGNRLAGRVALITGAGSGIGRSTAILFARQGASVFLVDLSAEGLKGTVAQLRAEVPSASERVATQTADCSSEEANDSIVAACIARFGTLHIFFANAGTLGNLSMADTSAADFARTLAVNVVGVHAGFQAALRHMLPLGPSHRGTLLATASVAGLRAGAGGVDYSSSKAAVINLVQGTAAEVAGSGVRVNCICPGLIETGMTGLLFDMARARKSERKIGQINPLRRAGSPHEVAALALFLASDEASYVNGQAIVVDGGLSASHPFVQQGSGFKAKPAKQ